MRTLWVEGSPKQEQSLSSAMAETFAAATPDAVGNVERFSVWSEDLLRFGREAALAKFAPLYGEQRTDAQEAA